MSYTLDEMLAVLRRVREAYNVRPPLDTHRGLLSEAMIDLGKLESYLYDRLECSDDADIPGSSKTYQATSSDTVGPVYIEVMETSQLGSDRGSAHLRVISGDGAYAEHWVHAGGTKLEVLRSPEPEYVTPATPIDIILLETYYDRTTNVAGAVLKIGGERKYLRIMEHLTIYPSKDKPDDQVMTYETPTVRDFDSQKIAANLRRAGDEIVRLSERAFAPPAGTPKPHSLQIHRKFCDRLYELAAQISGGEDDHIYFKDEPGGLLPNIRGYEPDTLAGIKKFCIREGQPSSTIDEVISAATLVLKWLEAATEKMVWIEQRATDIKRLHKAISNSPSLRDQVADVIRQKLPETQLPVAINIADEITAMLAGTTPRRPSSKGTRPTPWTTEQP